MSASNLSCVGLVTCACLLIRVFFSFILAPEIKVSLVSDRQFGKRECEILRCSTLDTLAFLTCSRLLLLCLAGGSEFHVLLE